MLKKYICLILSMSSFAVAEINIIPKPHQVKESDGTFTLNSETALIINDKLATKATNYLQGRLKSVVGFNVAGDKAAAVSIEFKTLGADEKLPKEAYKLQVTPKKVTISAGDESGFFYGAITLLQLMPAEVWSDKSITKSTAVTFPIPACEITDYPRFAWRGMMLDCSRQFHTKEYLKLFIDRMAQYKLNIFHWHLTDDEGWRIEIKKYPKLTEIGAKRGPGTQLPYHIIPAIVVPDKSKVQEGFYTQDDIREIIAYAQERSIVVVPEIDVPGHCKAAIVSYPELLQDPNDQSVYKSVQNTPNNTIDPGLETTFTFLEDVFAEVASLFPCEFIHVGGDERPPGAWEKSPAVHALMKKLNLKNTNEVQGYFFQRLEKILAKNGKTILGWEEILHGDKLKNPNTTIMAWHTPDAAAKASKAGFKVILSTAAYLYYDLKYINHPQENGLVWAGVTDTMDSYSYNPFHNIPTDSQKNILGVNGQLWSETIITPAIGDYMAWPRMCALAEIAWTSQEQRTWDDFSNRLFIHTLPKLAAQGIQFRVPVPAASLSPEGKMTLSSSFKAAEIRYTTDGAEPDKNATLYHAPFDATKDTKLKAAIFLPSGQRSRIIEEFSKPQ